MADYYPLLAKALANLPTRAAPTARRAIYERARKALIGQLRSIQPPMPESDIAIEDAALDQAIARLEAEYGAQSAPSTVRKPPAPAAAPAKPTPSASAPSPAARPTPPVERTSSPSSLRPATSLASAGDAFAKVPLAPPPRRPTMGSAPPVAPSSARAAPPIEPEKALANGDSSLLIAPPVATDRAEGVDDHNLAPPIAAPATGAGGLAPPRVGGDLGRPSAPGRSDGRRRIPWPAIAIAAIVCIACAIGLAAYLWWQKPQELATKPAPETAVATAQPGQNKIADRVKAGGPSDPPPAATETPIPTVTVPVAPIPAAQAPNSNSAPPVRAADAAPIAAASQTPAAAAPIIPESSRAAMLIGNASDPQKPLVALGTAVWSIIPAAPGQPSTLAVRIDVDVPDEKLHAIVTIRKNADASLPATHTIDLRTTFAEGSEIKGLKDMDLPRLRRDDSLVGDAVAGVRVKINDNYYLVGLTRSDTDAAHNLDLLATRGWFDFPLQLNDDRIAKLTFAKGEGGDRVLAQALDAWK